MEKSTFFLIVIINLLFCCQSNESVLETEKNVNNIINTKYYYTGEWEFNGLDEQDNYVFSLTLEFKANENNEFPKIFVNKDSVEINSSSIVLSPFVFNGHSTNDTIIINSNTNYINHRVILDSLIYIKDGLKKYYSIKIPTAKLDKYSNITDDGILHLVLALYITGGFVINDSNYEMIDRELIYATGTSTYFIPSNNELLYSNIGLN